MNLLNEKEMAFANEYIKVISQIVVTSSCSCLPPAYVNGLKEINAIRKYTQCVTCNSSIFLATNLFYKDYLYTKKEIDFQMKTEVSDENIQVKTKTTKTRKTKTK